MFIKKNKYYIYIENLSSINLNLIKIKSKFSLIYRYNIQKENIYKVKEFIKLCKRKSIKFLIMNDLRLALKLGANGIYLSAFNRGFLNKKIYLNSSFEIVGSAHNFREIYTKKKQGCNHIVLSRIFKTTYKNKKSFYGVSKFNLIAKNYNFKFIALGGIRSNNLMLINLVNCSGIALLSEVKKKPVIIHRLF